ncbi:MAG: 4Fe-4S dicluster domain-containing protein [Nitrospirae bacterium]|nr:4Fe-4S dicluster domain-containing protein [Nitrospirota bacterium]
MEESRREFFKKVAGGLIAGAAVITVTKKADTQTKVELPTPEDAAKRYKKYLAVDPLIRMQAELKESVKKPEKRWIMVIDLRKCVGCHACTVACMAENKLPPGIVYRPVMDVETGQYPNVSRKFTPKPCFHCENPSCVPVCPVGATWKREDGIVVIDYNKCIGCRYCLIACPYNVRVFDFGYKDYLTGFPASEGLILGQEGLNPFNEKPSLEYNKKWKREGHKSPVSNARKCHFCMHRISAGMLPACTVTCIGRATYFGDKLNPNSLVSELVKKPNVMRLRVELGTNPQCYYLV